MDLTLVKGIGPRIAERLRAEGVTTVEELRRVDVGRVSAAIGVPEELLRRWKKDAESMIGKSVEATAKVSERAGERVDKAIDDVERTIAETSRQVDAWRVVLRDEAPTAILKVGDKAWENLPILAAKIQENEEQLLSSARENVVLLKEQADTAWVKIEGQIHRNVPLFKEKIDDARGTADRVVNEVRVAVDEIRDRPEVKIGEAKFQRVVGRVLDKLRRGK